MPDIEKVLNGLQHCIEKLDSVVHKTHGFDCLSCSYLRKCESIGYLLGLPLMRDALELLKAQGPIEPIRDSWLNWHCGNCRREIDRYAGDIYCPGCGRKVAWDD